MKTLTDCEIWLNVALEDLLSSRVLYNNNRFRNAYFLFQQSSEKATKGFLLLTGMVNPTELKLASHNQFKSYRKIADNQLNEANLLLTQLNTIPSFDNLKFLDKQALSSHISNIGVISNLLMAYGKVI